MQQKIDPAYEKIQQSELIFPQFLWLVILTYDSATANYWTGVLRQPLLLTGNDGIYIDMHRGTDGKRASKRAL